MLGYDLQVGILPDVSNLSLCDSCWSIYLGVGVGRTVLKQTLLEKILVLNMVVVLKWLTFIFTWLLPMEFVLQSTDWFGKSFFFAFW